MHHQHFETIPSTHLYISEKLDQVAQPCLTTKSSSLITADIQTAGIGRNHGAASAQWMGRANNVFASALVLLDSTIYTEIFTLPLVIGALVLEELVERFPEDKDKLNYKFVNDIYRAGKKAGGILTCLPSNKNGKHLIINLDGEGGQEASAFGEWTFETLAESLQCSSNPFKYVALVSFGINLMEHEGALPDNFGTFNVKRSSDTLYLNQDIPKSVIAKLQAADAKRLDDLNDMVYQYLMEPSDGIPVSAEIGGPRLSRRLTKSEIKKVDIRRGLIHTTDAVLFSCGKERYDQPDDN